MTKRIEIVLTPNGPELKPSHSFQLQPRQRAAGTNPQASPSKPVAVHTVKCAPALSFAPKEVLASNTVPRKPPPADSPISPMSPVREGRLGQSTTRAVGTLLGEIRAATSSALRSVQSFHFKKNWDLYASSEWSSSPVPSKTKDGPEVYKEDKGRNTMTSATQRIPKKRDLNSFMRNSLLFCPHLNEESQSPKKRSNLYAALLDSRSPCQSSSSLFIQRAISPTRKKQEVGGFTAHAREAERNSDVPAPAPEGNSITRTNTRQSGASDVRKRTNSVTSPQSNFKAKLLAKALSRAKA